MEIFETDNVNKYEKMKRKKTKTKIRHLKNNSLRQKKK